MVLYSEQGTPQFLFLFTYLCVWWWTSTTSIHVKAENIHSLKLGDKLNSTSMLCSKQGMYCMNFSVSQDSETLGYLKMYVQRKDRWVVWIGNRDQPVEIDSAVLLLDNFGVLKIDSKNDSKILYSSPQPFNKSTTMVATLLDTGNFVLQDIQPNGTKIMLWQSFDYPTDSLLPGMKLGVNHKTGHNWSLVSWLTHEIPTSGSFKLEWEPGRRQLVIKYKEQVYWKSKEKEKNRHEYKIVSDENEDSFTLTAPNENLTIWTLLETGKLMSRGKNDIARADFCYGYKTDEGCQKWGVMPDCRNRGDGFLYNAGYLRNEMLNDIGNASNNINDCQTICWSNCSCIGFKNSYNNGTGCTFILSMDSRNIASGGDDNFYILVKSAAHNKGKHMWIWISTAIAIALLMICLYVLCRAKLKRKYKLGVNERNKMGTDKQDLEDSSGGSSSGNDLETDLSKGDELKVFSYTSINLATNGFLAENKLGQGGFGPVFKGILPSGQEVAVKKLSKTSGQGGTEFRNELTLISKLQHTNLVQLIGHCIHEQERMLIYEYMPNKSLDFFLFDATRRKFLDWNKRFSIIEGIAQGLLYLHKYSRLRIIHRDLKASNILLDENMNPKISDFGVAKMFTKQETEANTNRIVGTYGYMSPEYAMEGVFSTKSDVYSFGVLLLEIISGEKNNSFYSEDRPLNLVGHAWELWKEGMVLRLVDPSLNESFSEDEMLRCVHAGLLCVEENANDRPTMSSVISIITNKIKVDVLPKKPAYYGRTRVFEEETYAEETGIDSTHENTNSSLI